jgi:hypothetical protein
MSDISPAAKPWISSESPVSQVSTSQPIYVVYDYAGNVTEDPKFRGMRYEYSTTPTGG